MIMNALNGYRGYVFSRPIGTHRVPQHIQNLVIRSHAQKYNLHYLLSGVEHRMVDSYLMLNQILKDAKDINGIIVYSLFMLPAESKTRNMLLSEFLKSGKEVHVAVEDLILKNELDCQRVDRIFLVNNVVESMEYKEMIDGTIKFYARYS